jgi:hypothetical protein
MSCNKENKSFLCNFKINNSKNYDSKSKNTDESFLANNILNELIFLDTTKFSGKSNSENRIDSNDYNKNRKENNLFYKNIHLSDDKKIESEIYIQYKILKE